MAVFTRRWVPRPHGVDAPVYLAKYALACDGSNTYVDMGGIALGETAFTLEALRGRARKLLPTATS